MIEITLGRTTYVKIEKPENIIFIDTITNKYIQPFTVVKHEEGFEYTHGLDKSELVSEARKGVCIFIRKEDTERYSTGLEELMQFSNEVLKYNK